MLEYYYIPITKWNYYTILSLPSTPQQTGIVERHNHLLINMARSMISYMSLPLFLWGKLLKFAIYLLNGVQSKVVQRTPFEVWTNRKLSLNHVHI